ncbi:hypothetical protein HX785_02235 [Pseudomonas reactans]|jgi:hypothetical protein|uniref:hypothetical protein n=1 Tax=Pseudomonas reactans TaxID=117680 RepID=UPI0015A0CFE0|nr:hypothetical protein [Pseudomonas reactans]NWF12490.1 hypothetical protein [Pseudomonas reactans]
MSVDYSKGRYKIVWESGTLVGTIERESVVRLNGEVVFTFDDDSCFYDKKGDLVGRVGNGVFRSLGGKHEYRVEPL